MSVRVIMQSLVGRRFITLPLSPPPPLLIRKLAKNRDGLAPQCPPQMEDYCSRVPHIKSVIKKLMSNSNFDIRNMHKMFTLYWIPVLNVRDIA